MNCFMEPHEKIKELRKKYKITQSELAGEVYTQGYITSLERGVKRITERNLIEITARFNEILSERGIEDRIRAEDIKKSKEKEEEEFVGEILKELESIKDKNLFLKKYREIKLKIIEADEEKQVMVFEEFCKSAKELQFWDEMKDVAAFLVMKHENLNNVEKLGEAFLELTRACAMLGDPDYILPFEETYIKKIEKIDKKNLEAIYYNLGIIFSKGTEKEKAIYYLDELLKSDWSSINKFSILINKGFALEQMNKYDEAKKIYMQVLKENKDNKEICLFAKQNITCILVEEDNNVQVRKNYNYMKKEMKNYKGDLVIEKYGALGEIAIYLKKKKESQNYLELAVENIFDNYATYSEDNYADYIENLLKIYKRKDKEKVKKYEKLFEKFQKQEVIKKCSFAFLNYYNDNRLYSELKEFLEKYEKM